MQLDDIFGGLASSAWWLPACITVALLLLNSILLYILRDKPAHAKKKDAPVESDPTDPAGSGLVFVEDDEGHVVRRSSRVRKNVAGNVDYATLNTGTPSRQRRAAAKEAEASANASPKQEPEPVSPPASPKVSTRRRIKA